MIKEVKDNLSPKRFCHTMNVVSIAEKLGENYGLKGDEVFIAALYHDYAKEFSNTFMKINWKMMWLVILIPTYTMDWLQHI